MKVILQKKIVSLHRKETVYCFISSQNLTGPDPASVRPQWLYVSSKVKKPLVARTVRVEVKLS